MLGKSNGLTWTDLMLVLSKEDRNSFVNRRAAIRKRWKDEHYDLAVFNPHPRQR